MYIVLQASDYHLFRGQIFVDFTEEDWGRVRRLETEFEKKTAKAKHQCRRWAVDKIVTDTIREVYDHGF